MENQDSIFERVLVTQVSSKKTLVYVQPESCAECQTCAAGRGCRQNGIFRLFAGKEKTFPVEVKGKHNYKKGDVLVLSFAPHALLLATCCVYLFPLLALLVCALIGEWINLRTAMIPIFSFGGMASVYYVIRSLRGGTVWASIMRPSVRLATD